MCWATDYCLLWQLLLQPWLYFATQFFLSWYSLCLFSRRFGSYLAIIAISEVQTKHRKGKRKEGSIKDAQK
jgi:hypothetical protein